MTKQTHQPETAVGLLAEATLRAAVQIARSRNLNEQENYAERLSEALKTTVKGNLDRVQAEWKEALEANIGNAWLGEMMKAQAIELAQEAIALL